MERERRGRRDAAKTRSNDPHQEVSVVYMKVRDRESIQEAVRRFRKLIERSGKKKEMRKREYYVKPSETIRHAHDRAVRRDRARRLEGTQ
jgi:small subunit ribosomal protein S21